MIFEYISNKVSGLIAATKQDHFRRETSAFYHVQQMQVLP